MKIQATYGVNRSTRTKLLACVAAGALVVMLAAQLFGYEEFAPLLENLTAADARTASVLAVVIVLAELLSLPYLLSMYLSRLMRYVSAGLGFIVSGFWLFTSLTNSHAENSGLLSESLVVPGGIGAALTTLVLFACVCSVVFADSRFRHATS